MFSISIFAYLCSLWYASCTGLSLSRLSLSHFSRSPFDTFWPFIHLPAPFVVKCFTLFDLSTNLHFGLLPGFYFVLSIIRLLLQVSGHHCRSRHGSSRRSSRSCQSWLSWISQLSDCPVNLWGHQGCKSSLKASYLLQTFLANHLGFANAKRTCNSQQFRFLRITVLDEHIHDSLQASFVFGYFECHSYCKFLVPDSRLIQKQLHFRWLLSVTHC